MEKIRYSYKFIYGLIFLFTIMESSCKKTDDTIVLKETGTVTDVDGNIYKTIKIGNQWWMAEDLKVKKYKNGDFINQIQSDSLKWNMDTIGAYADNITNSNELIGRFYNWYTVKNAKQLAPEGWHIPTDNEWKKMEIFLGMNSSEADKPGWRGNGEGDKLKKQAPNGWTTFEKVWGNNESGFNAIANGCKLFNSNYGDPGQFATEFWWSISEQNNSEVWYRYLDYKNSAIFRSHTYKNYGFSVRCVKN